MRVVKNGEMVLESRYEPKLMYISTCYEMHINTHDARRVLLQSAEPAVRNETSGLLRYKLR